jgi:hypothetical protein
VGRRGFAGFGPGIKHISLAAALLLSACQLVDRTPNQPDPQRLLRTRGFEWVTDSSDHFRLHIESASPAAQRTDLLKFTLEHDRTRVLRLLRESDFGPVIDVFVVASRDQMQRLTGQSTNAIAYHRSRVIVLTITSEWSATSAHEILHVIAMNSWGVGPVWLNEGLAVLADGTWQGQPLHAAAKALLDRDQLVPLDELIKEFRTLAPAIAYPQAGSLIQYIADQYGIAAVKLLWQQESADFLHIVGKDLETVEKEWRAFLR